MKKIFVLSIIMTMLLLNAFFILYPKNNNLIDIFNILFLNIKNFELYNLDKLNFQYIISFCLLGNILLNTTLLNKNESFGYLGMIIYRIGTSKAFVKLLIENIIALLKSFCIMFIVMIIYFAFFDTLKYINIVDVIIAIIYLFKYMIFILNNSMIDNNMSLVNNNIRSLNLVNWIFIICLISDILFGSNIITFSADLFIELIYFGIYIIISILLLITSIQNLKRKKDIL